MKASEVLDLLQITRQTLTRYVKTGIVKAYKLPNNRYDYDNKDVQALASKRNCQRVCAYTCLNYDTMSNNKVEPWQCRITRWEGIDKYCKKKKYKCKVSDMYVDQVSSDGMDERTELKGLLAMAMRYELKTLIVYNMSDLTKTSCAWLLDLFKSYGCTVEVINISA